MKQNIFINRSAKLAKYLALTALMMGCSSNTLKPTHANNTDISNQIAAILAQASTQAAVDKSALTATANNVLDQLSQSTSETINKSTFNDRRFDLSVNKLAAKEFFAALAEDTPYNMIVHPDVRGSITLNLKDVTVPEVMDIVKEIYSLDYTISGKMIKVLSPGIRTQIFVVDYLNVSRQGSSGVSVSAGQLESNNNSGNNSNSSATTSVASAKSTEITTSSSNDFWSSLESTLSLLIGDKKDRKVIVTPDTGVVVVRANAEELKSVRHYLESSELILKRQVILEAKILEVELSDGYQQGIDWTFSRSTKELDSAGIPVKSGAFGIASNILTNASTNGVFTASSRIHDFNSVVQLLGTQGNVQVLSSPRISTVNNQKAVIKVGTDEYFITDIDLEVNSNTSNQTSTDIELTPFFSGIALDVTPQIAEDSSIILHVHPTISTVEDNQKRISIDGEDLDLPLAKTSVRESDSIISAQSGQIVVIGGLIQNRNVDDNSELPGAGSLPLVGNLFKQKRHSIVRSELVILIKPIVINNGKEFSNDIDQSRERFHQLGALLNRSNMKKSGSVD